MEANDMSAVWEEAVEQYEQQESSARVQNSMKIEREDHKLEKRLCREVGRAIVDFNMIEEGDKVMVCVSAAKTATPCSTSCSSCKSARPSTSSWWPSISTRSSQASLSTSCPSTWASWACPFTSRTRTPTASSSV